MTAQVLSKGASAASIWKFLEVPLKDVKVRKERVNFNGSFLLVL